MRVELKTDLDKAIEKAVLSETWILYKQPEGKPCPNCELLEKLLTDNDISHIAVNIKTPEALTEIAFRGTNPYYTPVLQKGTKIFYWELWQVQGKSLNLDAIKKIIDPDKTSWTDQPTPGHECNDGVCRI